MHFIAYNILYKVNNMAKKLWFAFDFAILIY